MWGATAETSTYIRVRAFLTPSTAGDAATFSGQFPQKRSYWFPHFPHFSLQTASLSNWTDAVQTLVWLHNSPSKASDPTVNTNQSPFNGPQDHKALSPVTSLMASHTTCPQAHQAYSWLTDFSLFAPFFWNLLSQNISSLTSLKSLLKRTL